MAHQNPVIVLPGITGTTLTDVYPLNPREVWKMVLGQAFDRISMHPDNPRYEALQPARVIPGQVFGLIYDDLIEALRYELSPKADLPTPVFAFPYDWRRPIADIALELVQMVREVIDRTKLLKHYKGWKRPKVDLVGHSMGGLVIAEYLHAFGKDQRVGKVATLGTPFRGAVEAVVKLATGLGTLTINRPSGAEREAARSTPAVYHLLPSYDGAVIAEETDGPSTDLFLPEAWQPGILASLSEYVRLHSVEASTKKANEARALALLQELLDGAKAHRKKVDGLDLRRAGLKPEDWLVVAGSGEETRVRVQTRFHYGKVRFRIENRGANTPETRDTGDGTVPLRGAIPKFMAEEKVVVVTDDEFGFLELRDRALEGIAGLHALLPLMNNVHRLIVRHLNDGFRGDLEGHPLPGLKKPWDPPIPVRA